jgi:hypothetical protein
MDFLRAYLRNLLVLALIIAGLAIFCLIFYPRVFTLFSEVIKVYSILKLWPLLILAILVGIIPRRSRRRK